MNKHNIWIVTVAIMLFSLVSCNDDETVSIPSENGLNLLVEVPEVVPYGRYYTLQTSGDWVAGERYLLSTDVEWLSLSTDTLPTDGILEFWVEENNDVSGRSATIQIASASEPALYSIIDIYQQGTADNDENATANAYFIGYSFDAFSEYESPSSVKAQVIDMNKLATFDAADVFQSVQTATSGYEDFSVVSATSLQELSSKLTQKMDENSNFMGVKKTIHRYSQVTSNTASEQFSAYSRLTKVLSTQSFDTGALLYIIENTPVDKLPFTDAFKTDYKAVINANGAARTTAINTLLNKYGTHIVSEASLGGMLDYIATFDRSKTSQLEVTSEEHCKSVFGLVTSSGSSESVKSTVTSDISNSASVQILGGDEGKRETLEKAIRSLTKLSDIPEAALNEWVASINTSSANLKPVDFKLFPIWNLFADETISNQVLAQVMALESQSNNQYTAQELATDNYLFLTNNTEFQFPETKGQTSSTSLAKIAYVRGVPIMEICEEYVPKIRSDKRIKVFYPIYSGKTNLAQGIFPGDGEGNAPAYLSFYEGDVYVSPIDGYGYYQTLDTLYYTHGNLYHKDYGIAYGQPEQGRTLTVADEYFQISNSSRKFAVVKIGSGYWTRSYITNEYLEFGYEDDDDDDGFAETETIVDGLLFANICNITDPDFLESQKYIYGPDVDASYKKSSLWYLPLPEDREALTGYLGYNLKALFKGQVSGFEAQFEGYYGNRDDNGKAISDGKTTRRNKGSKCYIAFRTNLSSSESSGEALLLTTDYTWEKIEIYEYVHNYYPVKLYRTAYFIHQTIN